MREYEKMITELKRRKKEVLKKCGEHRLKKEVAEWIEYAKGIQREGITDEIKQRKSDPNSYEYISTENSKAHIAAYNARIEEVENAMLDMKTNEAA